jgi:hypothetical protein
LLEEMLDGKSLRWFSVWVKFFDNFFHGLFLDDCKYAVYLHHVPIINRYGRVQFLFVPCMAGRLGALPCLFCDNRNYKFKYIVTTIYDMTPYTDKRGQAKMSGKKLLAMRNRFYKEEISRFKLRTTYMAEFEAVREMGEKESIGKGWVFNGFNNNLNLPPDIMSPYDYSHLFCRPTEAEIEEIMKLNKMYLDRRATASKGRDEPQQVNNVTPPEEPFF